MELIDDLQAIKNDEVSKTYELSEEATFWSVKALTI